MFFCISDIKVYSSESQSQPIKEKAIPLIDSLVQSVLDMIKLFQNSEFVNILFLMYNNYKAAILILFYININR